MLAANDKILFAIGNLKCLVQNSVKSILGLGEVKE
jgi:hypothetical protein